MTTRENKYLSILKKEFGKYGSWALWDNNGGIKSLLEKKNFSEMIRPNIVFVGLNASMKIPEDWINYHHECNTFGKIKSWKRTPVHKLADVIQEKEFSSLNGAYMTDILKGHYKQDSRVVMAEVKQNKAIILTENLRLFENELELLSKISDSNNFYIICMGDACFNILRENFKWNIYKVYHYANYGEYKVKERIRQGLEVIIKNLKKSTA